MDKFLFDNVYENNKKIVYYYILRMVNNSQVAEDLTQDTFMKVFKSLYKFRGESSIKVWIFKIAKNTCFTYFKRNEEKMKDIDYEIETIASDDKEEKQIHKLLIQEGLNKLSKDQKEIILLRDYYGFPYKDIADILQKNEGQVKILLHRSRKKFKNIYKEMIENENRL